MMKVRKGFTLVELLIVIIIIGILASAMMLSSGSATASAKASTIISDLRSLKAAALMLYADSMDSLVVLSTKLAIDRLHPYMDNPSKFPSSGTDAKYVFTGSSSAWFVGYTGVTTEIGEKLAGRTKTVGLLNSAATNATPYVKADKNVYLITRH